MEEATRVREVSSSTAEPEHESNVNNAPIAENPEPVEDDIGAGASYNSLDRQSEIDELAAGKSRNSKDRPTVEEIQVRFSRDFQFFAQCFPLKTWHV